MECCALARENHRSGRVVGQVIYDPRRQTGDEDHIRVAVFSHGEHVPTPGD